MNGFKVFKAIKTKDRVVVSKMDYLDYMKTLLNKKWVIPTKRGGFYIKTKSGLFHRLILDAKNGQYVDHIDRDTLNNERKNLRICTISENNRNSTPRGKYKGISYNKINKNWRVRVILNGKTTEIGSFKIEKDAVEARNKVICDFHKEFSYFNEYKGE